MIMKLTGGSTDTSKDIEYTDWERVAIFSKMVDRQLTDLSGSKDSESVHGEPLSIPVA